MLVLSRKLGESLVIADQEVVVTVLAVKGDRVRLGITAPSQVAIYRSEVWDREHGIVFATAESDAR